MTGAPRDVVGRGLAALTVAADRVGLPADDLELLSDRGNLIVRLAPAPVVARICTLTARTRRDPAAWMARELAVATAAARAGAPVLPPTDRVDPGPHQVLVPPDGSPDGSPDGLTVTFWSYLPPADAEPTPAEVGVALAELHRGWARAGGVVSIPLALPHLAPVRQQIPDALAWLRADAVLAPAELDELDREFAAVLAGLPDPGETIVLHGDAHPGNLLRDGDRWLWVDLEETCAGPRTWDLAVLAATTRLDGSAAVRAYADRLGRPEPSPAELAPLARARRLEGTVWLLCMAHQDPVRYAAKAGDALAGLRARIGGDRQAPRPR